MIVTIHQPNLFPWLGYFDKMAQADVFVALDTVPFTKGGFQNRVQLKGSNGPQWLTTPVVTSGRLGQITREVEINHRLNWVSDHLKTFQALYRGAPGHRDLIEELEALYGSASSRSRLVDFALPGIQMIQRRLGIATPIVMASQLDVSGHSSELLCDIVVKLGGDVYLSGPSGRNYLDLSVFERKGIRVIFHEFKPTPYPQRFGDFVGGLSSLDFLFNRVEGLLWRAS